MRLLTLFVCAVLLFIGGCKGTPGQGGGPPSPLEVQILTTGTMSALIAGKNYDAAKLEKLHGVLTSAKNTINLALSNDPDSIETVSLEFIEGLDPVFRDIVGSVVQIVVLRVKPYIDTENQDLQLAKTYVDAIFTGAIQAVEVAQSRQAYYFEEPPMEARLQVYPEEAWPVIK